MSAPKDDEDDDSDDSYWTESDESSSLCDRFRCHDMKFTTAEFLALDSPPPGMSKEAFKAKLLAAGRN